MAKQDPLIGREAAIDELCATLSGAARLVTLVGIGGVGKSRVALAAAAVLGERGQRIGVGDLSAVHGPTGLAIAIAQALGIGGATGTARAPLDALVAALRELAPEPRVLVLDNFEQLVGGTGEIGEIAGRALVSCLAHAPGLRILVTSRRALALPEEVVVLLPPIAHDGPDSPAVRLLLERAGRFGKGAAWQDRAALERLARRLDGVPLALELAAARASRLSPQDMLGLMDASADPKHDAMIAWSWDQLSPAERDGLCRLTAIEGAFDFTLASRMLAVRPANASDHLHPLEILEGLVRVSLVAIEPGPAGTRYRLLETVREHARAMSTDAAHDAALDDLAEALFARLPPADELAYFTQREPELDLDERVRLLGVVRRAQADARVEVLSQGLRAAAELTLAFARSGFGATVMRRLFELLDRAEIEQVSLEVRLMAGTCAAAVGGADLDLASRVDRVIERMLAWTRHSDNPRQALVVQSIQALTLNRRWDFPRLYPLSRMLIEQPIIAADLRLYRGPVERYVFSRRALGLSEHEADQRLLADLQARLHAAGEVFNALHVHANRACLALNLREPEQALALIDEVEPAAIKAGFLRLATLMHRERARAERECGHRAGALAAFDEALRALAGTNEHTEGVLDRAATALEAGRHDEARRDLDAAAASLTLAGGSATPFERGYQRALEEAYATLTGEIAVNIEGDMQPTGNVEDAAFEALCALASEDREAAAAVRARVAAAAPFSFRACHALRLFDAVQGLALNVPEVMAVATEGAAFRVHGRWIDLTARPLLAVLLDVLTRARLDGVGRVDKPALAEAAWPGERMRPESRDRRLEVAMSKLRKEGLRVVGEHGGYTLDPELRVLRVARARWPGQSDAKVARGRGRPRRDAKA